MPSKVESHQAKDSLHRTRSGRRQVQVRRASLPELALALVAASLVFRHTQAATDPGDILALQAFKLALANPEVLNWPAGGDPCAAPWPGISCVQSPVTQYKIVNQIRITDVPLGGTLAPEIGTLAGVKSIFLGNTSIGGPIPATLSQLTNLVILGLNQNKFSSVPPKVFTTLTSLTGLYLLVNPINGQPPLPDLSTLSNLVALDLTQCGFGGTVPPYLGTLTGLTYLGLAGNKLSGPIPPDMFANGMPYLVRLTLNRNNLEGPIPKTFSTLTSLTNLALSWNQLSGTIPPELATLPSLASLTLSHNNLVGPIPTELGTILPPNGNLATFEAAANSLSGPIPDFMGAFPPVSYSQNGFCTNIAGAPCDPEVAALSQALAGFGYPPSLTSTWVGPSACPGVTANARPWRGVVCSGSGMVSGLLLANQKLTGQLSPAVGQLQGLTNLQIQNNSLGGPFPAAVTQLPNLQRVDISNNRFTGPPPQFAYAQQVTLGCNAFVPPTQCGPAPVPKPIPKTVPSPVPRPKTPVPVPVPIVPNPVLSPPATATPTPVTPTPVAEAYPPPSGTDTAGEGRDTPPSGSNGGVDDTWSPAPAPGIAAGEPPPPSSSSKSGNQVSLGAILGGVGAAVVLTSLACCLGLFLYVRRRNKVGNDHMRLTKTKSWPSQMSAPTTNMATAMPMNKDLPGTFRTSLGEGRTMGTMGTVGTVGEDGSLFMSLDDLKAATENFADARIVGKGGFATVYKASLPSGREVAVKRMEVVATSGKGVAEFQAEISVLTGVRHRHLVSLLGYVADAGERLLVYEYMSLGPLSHHLFCPAKRGLKGLSWERRLLVALDVAKGVEYLHHLAHKSFIHRDLKPSNILLDTSFRAKVADFGLVKPTDIVDNFASVETRLAGTFGYLAPEYAATGKVTVMSDVYSYGVILMELITGRRSLDESQPENRVQLVAWLTPHINDAEKLFRVVDPLLADEIQTVDGPAFRTVMEVANLALHCVARDPRRRPNMSTVVAVLTPLVAKWQPHQGLDEEEHDNGIDITASLAEEVEKWHMEEDEEIPDGSFMGSQMGASFAGNQSAYMQQQSGYHTMTSEGGYSTLAAHHSVGITPLATPAATPGAGHGDAGRGVQSFAGRYTPSGAQTPQSFNDVSTSMRDAQVEPR